MGSKNFFWILGLVLLAILFSPVRAATRDEALRELSEKEVSPLEKLLTLQPESDSAMGRRKERELFSSELNISSATGNISNPLRKIKIFSREADGPSTPGAAITPNVLFRPQKNPPAQNPSVMQLLWGKVQPAEILPLNLKDLSSKEGLVRISLQGKSAEDPFWVILQQGERADDTWISPKLKLMRSGESIKIARAGLLHLGLWLNDNVPFVSEWIDLSCPGVDIIYAPHAWTTALPNWTPLDLHDAVKPLSTKSNNRETIGIQRLDSIPGGPSLLLLGPPLSALPSSIITPKDWLDLANRAKKNGQLIYLKGLQRTLPHGDRRWFPMALLAQAKLLQGVILWDGGDEAQYRDWLQAGYPLGLLADVEVNRGGAPVTTRQRVCRQNDKEDTLALIRNNRVICVENINFELNLQMEATLDGNTVQPREHLGVGDCCEKEGIFLPKLVFECGPVARGIRAIELFRGATLLQMSDLRQPLREGWVHFATEEFRAGDVVTVVLEDVQGVRHRSNPIFFGNLQERLLNKPTMEQGLLNDEFLFINDKTFTALEVLRKYQDVQNRVSIDSPKKLE